MKLNVSATQEETARSLIRYIIEMLRQDDAKLFHIAFSGGNTPSLLFELWAKEYKEITPWHQIRFWWVDERCVPPDDADSNFGMMDRLLLCKVPVEPEQVFRIRGEASPQEEAERYSHLVRSFAGRRNGQIVFDLVLLGVGDDGHTSSIFPGQDELLVSPNPYEVSYNPYNGQVRIAMTAPTIINARRIAFLVTGAKKAEVVGRLCAGDESLPSGYVAKRGRSVGVFMDEKAWIG